MKLTELFSPEELDAELQAGYVKEQKHPTLPLVILNYTDKATYDRRWNNVTMHCRGLIVDEDYREVIARGPRKFFNYGEPSAVSYPLDTKVILSRKEDGSLGIGWVYGDEELDEYHSGIATRGSFTSEQAVHATKLVEVEGGHNGLYELHYDSLIQYADDDLSYIGEIVYPENRIVLDYGGRDELIPLGTVNNRTGVIQWRPEHDHSGNEVIAHSDVHGVITLGEALALQIPDNEEGYVLDILDRDSWEVIDHLKLKGARYKELHAAIFGLSERAVWEQFVEGTQKDFIAALPDEVQPWAQEVSDRLWKEHDKLWWRIVHAHNALWNVLGIGYSRKEAAIYLKKSYPDVMSPVFNLLDGREDRKTEWILKQIKPEHVPFSATKTLESASV